MCVCVCVYRNNVSSHFSAKHAIFYYLRRTISRSALSYGTHTHKTSIISFQHLAQSRSQVPLPCFPMRANRTLIWRTESRKRSEGEKKTGFNSSFQLKIRFNGEWGGLITLAFISYAKSTVQLTRRNIR